jgi:predicted metal-dependent phosphoesterase TrpH
MHTTVSDGSDTPEEIITLVKKAGIRLFSVTDHDAVKGCQVIQEKLSSDDPAFICGAEFSCRDQMGKYHILGYHYDPDADAIQRLVDKSHNLRMKKVAARLDFIRDKFGCVFPEEEIDVLLSLDNPGKPHIGNLMVKYGYAESKDEAMIRYLNRLHYRSEYVRPETAITGILKAGGIPVLAHPSYGSGSQMITGENMDARIRKLMVFGLFLSFGLSSFFGFAGWFLKMRLREFFTM